MRAIASSTGGPTRSIVTSARVRRSSGASSHQRIRERMEEELAKHPVEQLRRVLWLAAAARGNGDLQAAWDAAQAGWVRAPLPSRAGQCAPTSIGGGPRHRPRSRARARPTGGCAAATRWEQFRTLEAVSIRAFRAANRQRRGATLSADSVSSFGRELQHCGIAEQPEAVARTAAVPTRRREASR